MRATGLVIILALAGILTCKSLIQNFALADSSKIVSVFADDRQKIVSTEATTVGDFLSRVNIKVEADDLVEPDVKTVIPQGFFNINVYRAQAYRVVDGSNVRIIHSAHQSLRKIITSSNITLFPEDSVSAEAVTDFVEAEVVGQSIIIDRATPLTLVADGKVAVKRTQAKTIDEFIKTAGISLGEKDTITPALGTPVTPDQKVSITRVAEVVVTKDETIPRPVQTETDPDKPKGDSQVKSEGSDGHRQATYRIHYHDGVEVARETLKVEGQVEPKPKIMVVGTKVFFGGSVEYWRPMVAEAAAANGIDPNRMLRIMACESGGNANASNGTHFGLFQYLRTTWRSAGGSDDNIFDGPTQIRLTAYKMAHFGYGPWVCQ